MDSGRISSRYAHAIYRYAEDRGDETRLWNEMKALAVQFALVPQLTKTLENPIISNQEKQSLLVSALKTGASDTYRRVTGMVTQNSRAGYMRSIALMYDRVYRKQKRLQAACILTAAPISSAEQKALISLVSKTVDETVELETLTDESLIGGFVLQINDQRLNASVKSQLNRLKVELTK
jgi:F-type H+-transporting ATPase subunit delta